MEFEAKLAHLLAEMFGSEALRRFLRHQVDPRLTDELPGPGSVGAKEYAARAAEELVRRGLITPDFCRGWARERPERRAEIFALLGAPEPEADAQGTTTHPKAPPATPRGGRFAARLLVTALLIMGVTIFMLRSGVSATCSDDARLIASPECRALLDARIAQLSRFLEPELLVRSEPGHEAWGRAQVAVALQGLIPLPSQEIFEILQSEMDPECQCWRRLHAAEDSERNVAVTAWVVLSQAKLGVVHRPAVEFLLGLQRSSGAWPVSPGSSADSTYTTILCALALQALIDAESSLDLRLADELRRGLHQSARWLISTELNGAWVDYPGVRFAISSRSLTGMALHVISSSYDAAWAPAVAERWTEILTAEPPPPSEAEINGENLFSVDGTRIKDTTRYYLLPWLIVGTMDAYPRLSPEAKQHAAAWVERALRSDMLTEGEHIQKHWQIAELVIALRYLRGDDVL